MHVVPVLALLYWCCEGGGALCVCVDSLSSCGILLGEMARFFSAHRYDLAFLNVFRIVHFGSIGGLRTYLWRHCS